MSKKGRRRARRHAPRRGPILDEMTASLLGWRVANIRPFSTRTVQDAAAAEKVRRTAMDELDGDDLTAILGQIPGFEEYRQKPMRRPALGNGIKWDTLEIGTSISMTVSFVQQVTFEMTIFGK